MPKLSTFHGVYPVVPTPLKKDESLDLAGMEHLAEFYVKEGCHGLLVLGSGGESPFFTIDEKVDILKTVAQKVKKKVPVIAGCTFLSLAELSSFMKKGRDLKIDGYLVALPAYFPLKFDDVYNFYTRVIGLTDKKVLYYHFPQITGLFFKPDQMAKLFAIPGIAGAKESAVCLKEMRRDLASVKGRDFSFFSGTSQLLLETLEAGGSGTMCSIPSVAPKMVVDCYNAWIAGDKKRAGEKGKDVFEYIGLMNSFAMSPAVQTFGFKVISRLPFHTGVGRNSRQAVFKEMLRQMGHPVTATVRTPLPQLAEADRAGISALIKRLGIG
jgi:2-dehydro-3-deoxy-D-pentonate aldolase